MNETIKNWNISPYKDLPGYSFGQVIFSLNAGDEHKKAGHHIVFTQNFC